MKSQIVVIQNEIKPRKKYMKKTMKFPKHLFNGHNVREKPYSNVREKRFYPSKNSDT